MGIYIGIHLIDSGCIPLAREPLQSWDSGCSYHDGWRDDDGHEAEEQKSIVFQTVPGTFVGRKEKCMRFLKNSDGSCYVRLRNGIS